MQNYTNSQGLTIHYTEAGNRNAKTILFFGGYGMPNSALIDPMFDTLVDCDYHCVAYDYRGYGESTRSRYNSMAWCAQDGKELLEHLKIDKAVFYGYSMGVSVILAYFKAFSDTYVDGVMMIDQPPCVTSREDWPYGRLRGKQDVSKLLKSLSKMFHDPEAFTTHDQEEVSVNAYPEILSQLEGMDNEAIMAALPQKVLENIRALGKREGGGGNIDYLASIATWFDSGYQDFRPVVSTIKVPTLVISPTPGSLYMPEASEYYRDHLGGPVTFVEIQAATHGVLFEHYPTIKREMVDYLSKYWPIKI